MTSRSEPQKTAQPLALCYHFPDGKRFEFTCQLRFDTIEQLAIPLPTDEHTQRFAIETNLQATVLQFEHPLPNMRTVWYDIAQNRLLIKAGHIPPSKLVYWHNLLVATWHYYTLNYLMASLYFNLKAEPLFRCAWHLHEKVSDFFTEQIGFLRNIMALLTMSSATLEHSFALWQLILPEIHQTMAAHGAFVWQNRTFLRNCQWIPPLAIPDEIKTEIPKHCTCWQLFKIRTLQMRQNLAAIQQLRHAFIFAPDTRLTSPIIMRESTKIDLPTPWGILTADLTLIPRTKAAKITVHHSESSARRLLSRWGRGRTTEELQLLINALGILPD